MDVLRSYLLRLITASLISGILCSLSERTFFRKQMQLVCSIYLTAIFLSPIRSISLPDIGQVGNKLMADAQTAVIQGEKYHARSLASIIKKESEAYIQKEAERIGAKLNVEIVLNADDPPIPKAVIVSGAFDSEMRQVISGILIREFGIPKENQTWIKQESREYEPS